jgi:hypothetical protein
MNASSTVSSGTISASGQASGPNSDFETMLGKMTSQLTAMGNGVFKPQASTAEIPASSGSALSVSGDTINTGRYTITFSTNYSDAINGHGTDGGVRIYDNQTHTYLDVVGDPHVVSSGGAVGDFQQDCLEINLSDGTTVIIKPTALSNGVSHIAEVAVSKGGKTVVATGMVGGGGVKLTKILNESAAKYDSYFGSANVAVLEASATKGLADMSVLTDTGSLTAMGGSVGDQTSLDSDALSQSELSLLNQLSLLMGSGSATSGTSSVASDLTKAMKKDT